MTNQFIDMLFLFWFYIPSTNEPGVLMDKYTNYKQA